MSDDNIIDFVLEQEDEEDDESYENNLQSESCAEETEYSPSHMHISHRLCRARDDRSNDN